VCLADDDGTPDAAATEARRAALRAATHRDGHLYHRNGAYYTP